MSRPYWKPVLSDELRAQLCATHRVAVAPYSRYPHLNHWRAATPDDATAVIRLHRAEAEEDVLLAMRVVSLPATGGTP